MFKKRFPFNYISYFLLIVSSLIILLWGKNVIAFNTTSQTNSHSSIEHHHVAQGDFDQIEIKANLLKNNIYMLEGEGGNIGLSVGNDGILMIDSQFAPLSAKIKSSIEGISNQPIRYLFNTHYHFDHTGGNENFANQGALIIGHENMRKQMKVPHSYTVIGADIPVSPDIALPKITVNETINFYFNGNEIRGFHAPFAHTDGDIVLHFVDQNIIHTGDLFFNGMYPFIDTEVGGSVDGMIAGIDKILPLCDDQTILIPGHGKVGNKQELIAFQEMLKIVNQRVKDSIEQNMTLDELIDKKILADLDDTWGKGVLNEKQFLTITYQGIKK
ncbi:MBL fold metallo-hydrolase [Geminocystis sp. CENA526]|uniref:MBL fold metallo-hydrolase n=1 Tax=Geminocystis sp. CENA526 TaxID=1355871 RepID=UPI003D6DD2C7